MVDGILWRLRRGSPWRDLPDALGPWKTVIGWLKECRAVFSCFEKTAINYAGMVKMAMIQRYLRLLA
jgi:transposase